MSELDKLYEIWIRDDSAQSYSINISKACREIKSVMEVVEAARYIEDNLGHWFLNPSGASELKEAMHRQRCAIKKLDEARRG